MKLDEFACDTTAGEVFIIALSGIEVNLEMCKMACERDAKCKAFTYLTYFDESEQCNFYSTPCEALAFALGAVSYRLVRSGTTTAETTAMNTARASTKACDKASTAGYYREERLW